MADLFLTHQEKVTIFDTPLTKDHNLTLRKKKNPLFFFFLFNAALGVKSFKTLRNILACNICININAFLDVKAF